MKAEDIILLLNAGYTKADIESMTVSPEAPTPAEGAGSPSPEEPEPPKPADPELPGIAELIKSNELLREQIRALQSKNIRETDGGMPENVGADQVIKDFFGPTKRKE